jgi:valyl-tRNA synthetase
LSDLHAVRGTSMPSGLAVLSGSGVQVGLDLSDAVDTEAEKARLVKQLAKAEKEREGTGRKLGNEGFLAKASPDTVASIRARNEAAEAEIARLQTQLDALHG